MSKKMSIEDIVATPGIVIRHIPKKSPPTAKYPEGKEHSLAGFAVEFDPSQMSKVQFSTRLSGFGATLQEAYYDFIKKRGKH